MVFAAVVGDGVVEGYEVGARIVGEGGGFCRTAMSTTGRRCDASRRGHGVMGVSWVNEMPLARPEHRQRCTDTA